jgi:hypothetical protein
MRGAGVARAAKRYCLYLSSNGRRLQICFRMSSGRSSRLGLAEGAAKAARHCRGLPPHKRRQQNFSSRQYTASTIPACSRLAFFAQQGRPAGARALALHQLSMTPEQQRPNTCEGSRSVMPTQKQLPRPWIDVSMHGLTARRDSWSSNPDPLCGIAAQVAVFSLAFGQFSMLHPVPSWYPQVCSHVN